MSSDPSSSAIICSVTLCPSAVTVTRPVVVSRARQARSQAWGTTGTWPGKWRTRVLPCLPCTARERVCLVLVMSGRGERVRESQGEPSCWRSEKKRAMVGSGWVRREEQTVKAGGSGTAETGVGKESRAKSWMRVSGPNTRSPEPRVEMEERLVSGVSVMQEAGTGSRMMISQSRCFKLMVRPRSGMS